MPRKLWRNIGCNWWQSTLKCGNPRVSTTKRGWEKDLGGVLEEDAFLHQDMLQALNASLSLWGWPPVGKRHSRSRRQKKKKKMKKDQNQGRPEGGNERKNESQLIGD